MKIKLTFSAFLLLLKVSIPITPLQAQWNLTTVNTPISQNFDALATSGSTNAASGGIFNEGWSFLETGTNANTTYQAGTGSDNVGNTYSFGLAGVNDVTDRAFGMLQ